MKTTKVFSLLSLCSFFLISNNFYGQNICTNYTVTPGTAISPFGTSTYNTTINIPDSYVITDVNVTVNISHTRNNHLDIYLISPSGSTVELSTDNGGKGNNYNNVTFDDASGNILPTGNTTLSGTYRPEGSLSGFNGENSSGNWILRVIDDANGDGGTINSITLDLCHTPTPIGGYSGPGGVGSNDGTSDLIIWYRPDSGISTTGNLIDSWINSAGVPAFNINEIGTQRPTLVSGAINGYDEVSFSGSNRLRTGPMLNSSNFIVNQASSFIITRADNTWQTSSVYLTDGLDGNRFSNHIPWSGTVYFDIGNCCGTDARIAVGGLTGLNNYSIWSYDAHPTSGKQLYRNEDLLQDRANTSTFTNYTGHRFNLGGNTAGANGFMGDVGELIIFKTKVNTAQRIIINNYLSAKYNQQLTSNDIYTRDNPGNGNFDHHVAGIGQADDGSNHTDSRGTGIVRINNPTDLDNNEYLFWGEETINPTYNFSTNTINYTEQLNSRWRVSQPGNNIGNVTISFDISVIVSGKQGCVDLELVIDNNYDFLSPSDVYPLTIIDNTATATGVQFPNNHYFTLRYTDQIVWNGTNFFNGAGAGNAPNNTDSCLKLTVKSGTAANLVFDAHVKEVEIEAGATLNVADGILIRSENHVVINGNLNLLGEAQLIQNHTGPSLNSGTGSLRIRQQGTTNAFNYNYWSSPVTRGGNWQIGYLEDVTGPLNFTSGINPNPATFPITLSSRWLYSFKGPSGDYNSWIKLSQTTNLTPGFGFSMKGSGRLALQEEYIFRGIPNDGTYTIPVTANTDFLTGNPYPSTMDANQFITDNLPVIDGSLYFWESFVTNNSHYLSDYEGGYAVYNLSGVSLPAVADLSGLTSGLGAALKPAPTQYINVGQGFFTTITNSGTLTFNNAQRAFARESLGATVYYKTNNTKDTLDERPKIWFSFTAPKGQTKIIGLGYDFHATQSFDKGYDAKSYDNLRNDLYWLLDEESLAIQALPNINIEDDLPLEMKISDAGLYKFSINKMENVPSDLNVYLLDKNQNIYYNLRDTEALLFLDKGTFDEYSIVFTEDESLSTMAIENKNTFVSYNPNTKVLELHTTKPIVEIESFQIYNVLGQVILNIKTPESNSIDISSLSNSIYFLKVNTKHNEHSKSIKFVKY